MTKRRPPNTPYVYRLFRDASGQSETFGVLLLLAITIAGTTAIITFGSTALTETENAANYERTEHTMTLLDSRSAMVALGDSEMQTVTFANGGEGTFRINDSAGHIKIKHVNYTDSATRHTEVIYSRSLGMFVYDNGETQIAYQGGGAWRVDGDHARMVSQPEFHYRGSTLTLPIIRIDGDGEATGRTSLTVRSTDDTRRIFPNSDSSDPSDQVGSPYNESGHGAYTNPVENGDIVVFVQSEFYTAWADYFRSRTEANVTVHDANRTVKIILEPLGVPGHFGSLQNDISISGMPEAHTTTNFTVTMEESGNNQFQHMTWSWSAESGNEKMELYYESHGNTCSEIQDSTNDKSALVNVFYTNGTNGLTQEWEAKINGSDDMVESMDCTGDHSITLNWTAPTTELEYRAVTDGNCAGGGNGNGGGSDPDREFGDQYDRCDGTLGGNIPMGQHDIDSSDAQCCPFQPGEHANVSFLTNHYLALLGPSYKIVGTEHNNDRLDESDSEGTLDFVQSSAKFLQYLHVTENNVTIETG